MSKKLPWIQLGGKQQPPFDEKIGIWLDDGEDSCWTEAWLSEIITKQDGTQYIFKNGDSEYDYASHFILLTPP